MTSTAGDLRRASDVEFGESLALAALSLARSFADGATLWCVAPAWPEHARHVAVEFVHPVIVGKRALPAVAVDNRDPVARLRPLVRAGDVVLAVSAAGTSTTIEVMRRAEVWGATRVWVGAGDRPPGGCADHVLWVDADGAEAFEAVHDGRVVLLYHVLWELTHVCFEHPGLLDRADDPGCDNEVCITCSDEGRLGEIVATGPEGSARVRTAQGIEVVDTRIVAPVSTGDVVLIHAGVVLSVVAP